MAWLHPDLLLFCFFHYLYRIFKDKLQRRLAHQQFFIFLCFAVFVSAIYSNTFNASWHLDDRPNILNNYYLHLDSLHPSKLVQTFFTDTHNPEQLSDSPYRPVACLTFALNWYLGQDNELGYHIVNTVIHILTTFFLFLFILNLFNIPLLKKTFHVNPFFIALLTSLLWAANPIQTQAVTYIVQRMAQLAALFYILGMWAYVKARLSQATFRRYTWFAACAVFYLLGVNSKPNAAMLPMALLLLEIIFFQNLSDIRIRKKALVAAVTISALILLFGSFFFLQEGPSTLFNYLYDERAFTLKERLLTQPRVILFYLFQIFYPMPSQFSIAHDVILSNSLLSPWTTLPSILIIFFLIMLSIFQIRKRPILSFSILFYFINHVIESSIIGLEIIFEHRNYLPSFFLFLPVAYLLNSLLYNYRKKNLIIYSLIGLLVPVIVLFFSYSTYVRNQAWKDGVTLWQDAVSKAPNNARALNTLAIKLAWGNYSKHPKRYDMALKLFKESLEKHLPRKDVKAEIYGNMGFIYFYKKRNQEKGFEHFEKALEINPESLEIRRDLVNALILEKKFDDALPHVNRLLAINNNNGIYHNLKGHIHLWQKEYELALSSFKKAYELLANKVSVIFNTSIALSLSGRNEKAEKLLLHAIKKYPENITFYLALIENSMRMHSKSKAVEYTKKMLARFDEQKIKRGIDFYTNNPKYAPISKEMIAPVILTVLEDNDY